MQSTRNGLFGDVLRKRFVSHIGSGCGFRLRAKCRRETAMYCWVSMRRPVGVWILMDRVGCFVSTS